MYGHGLVFCFLGHQSALAGTTNMRQKPYLEWATAHLAKEIRERAYDDAVDLEFVAIEKNCEVCEFA